MALVENRDGPGSSFLYILQCFTTCYNPESILQEGLLSVLVGSFAFFLVSSTPRDCKFLTEFQKE